MDGHERRDRHEQHDGHARRSRYRKLEGKHLIEIKVRSPQQLFDARDPSPFRERDLDDDLVEYVVASAREIPSDDAIRIVIYVSEPEGKELNKIAIRDAIHEFLTYKIEIQHSELRAFLRRAQKFMVLGMVTLIMCLSFAQSMTVPTPPGWIGILREGLVIFGWVSVWKPIELFMFDWYPLYEMRRLFIRLQSAEIDLRFMES